MGMAMSRIESAKGLLSSGNQLQAGITAGSSIGNVCVPSISYYSDSTCTTANY